MSEKHSPTPSPVVLAIMASLEAEIDGFLDRLVDDGMSENQIRSFLIAAGRRNDERNRESRLTRIEEKTAKQILTLIKLGIQSTVGITHDEIQSLIRTYDAWNRQFFERPEYGVGKTQWEMLFVLQPPLAGRRMLAILAARAVEGFHIRAQRRMGGLVLDLNKPRVRWSEEFEANIAKRTFHLREAPPADEVYVCYGVHGGTMTHGFRLPESLEYFKDHDRSGLTLFEALLMIAQHPFVIGTPSQRWILCLGETYGPKQKFAAIGFEPDEGIIIDLVSKDEADAIFCDLERFKFQDVRRVNYGKPSAKIVYGHSMKR